MDKLFLIFFLFLFCKNIINSIYIILIQVDSSIIINENNFLLLQIN